MKQYDNVHAWICSHSWQLGCLSKSCSFHKNYADGCYKQYIILPSIVFFLLFFCNPTRWICLNAAKQCVQHLAQMRALCVQKTSITNRLPLKSKERIRLKYWVNYRSLLLIYRNSETKGTLYTLFVLRPTWLALALLTSRNFIETSAPGTLMPIGISFLVFSHKTPESETTALWSNESLKVLYMTTMVILPQFSPTGL